MHVFFLQELLLLLCTTVSKGVPLYDSMYVFQLVGRGGGEGGGAGEWMIKMDTKTSLILQL